MKDYNKAIADYTQAIRLEPNIAIFYNQRGIVYYSTGDYNKAIADIETAIQLEPNNTTFKQTYLDNARKARGR
jgi:tetratricopeptide (TPR) repeat protein